MSIASEINPCILLVDTDEAFARRASLDLKEVGYTTVEASDTSRGFYKFSELQPAMVVLDNSIAGETGRQFCQQLRRTGSQIPVLMLLERATVDERVFCLDSGADDYLVKPYQSRAFLQLIHLYLQPADTSKEQLRFGELTLDLTTRRASRNGQAIDLTMKEFELLKYFMSHPREILTREQILENVWGYDFRGESNVIEVYIRYLRLKIEQDGQKRLIQTIRGVGYVLRES